MAIACFFPEVDNETLKSLPASIDFALAVECPWRSR
jgi:hypothetical protein